MRAGLTPIASSVLAARGPFLGQSGMSAVVAEGTLGRGRIMASQLIALEQYGRDSVATTYLRNLAKYIFSLDGKPVASIKPWLEAGHGNDVVRELCVPLDISKSCNRGFADEKAGDGREAGRTRAIMILASCPLDQWMSKVYRWSLSSPATMKAGPA